MGCLSFPQSYSTERHVSHLTQLEVGVSVFGGCKSQLIPIKHNLGANVMRFALLEQSWQHSLHTHKPVMADSVYDTHSIS